MSNRAKKEKSRDMRGIDKRREVMIRLKKEETIKTEEIVRNKLIIKRRNENIDKDKIIIK